MNRKTLAMSTLLVMAVSWFLMQGQEPEKPDAEVGRLLAQMSDSNWEQRSAAFYGLVALARRFEDAPEDQREATAIQHLNRSLPARAPEIKSTLTRTLDTENKAVKGSADITEDHSDYYADLIAAVTAFDDSKSAETLTEAMGTGNMVIKALAGFGDAGARAVMKRMEAADAQTGSDAQAPAMHDLRVLKQSGCLVLGRLLDPANPDGIKSQKMRDEIKSVLKKTAVEQGSAYVRMAAVKGLAKLSDQDVVPFLSQIAKSDTYDASKFIEDPGAAQFPVRAAALSSLSEMGKGSSNSVQKQAVAALVQVGEQESGSNREQAAKALTELVQDESSQKAVRDTAEDALRRLNIPLPFGDQSKPESQESPEPEKQP